MSPDPINITTAPTAARAAALWWAEQVGAPVFDNLGATRSQYGRQERDANEMAGLMASLIASDNPVSEEAGAAFADELERRITAEMPERSPFVSLGVDYGPDLILAEPAAAAGVALSRFPWKTHMHVRPDHVIAARGYGYPYRLVWTAPGWRRPLCENQRYEDQEPRDEVCPKPKYHEEPCGDWQPDQKRCGLCGGTYSDHYGSAAYEKASRCYFKPMLSFGAALAEADVRRATGDLHDTDWPQAVTA